MTDPISKIATLTDQDVKVRLREALQSWPLYRKLQYSGADDTIVLPENISLYCARCNNLQRWATNLVQARSGSPGMRPVKATEHKVGFGAADYTCQNCIPPPNFVRYYFRWSEANGVSEFFKVGQWPPIDDSVPIELQKHLDEEDLDFYKKATRQRNHGLGIAAVAYLRRVVENRINDILDVLAEAAREHDFAAQELQNIEVVKASRRFDDKITCAAKLLPAHLRPKGQPNPIDKLHELTSEGLHSKSEDECIEIFDRVRKVFEYVFGNLQVQLGDAREFVKSLTDLNKPPRSETKEN